MRAVVWKGIGEIAVEELAEPKLEEPTDAIVRLTASAICGTDLHFIRGTMPGMKKGMVLGHEGVGVIEALGDGVRNFNIGDRVVIPSTIACGNCSYCRAGYYAQCDAFEETAFFGGPEGAGGFAGLQAEKARVPFAHVGLVKLPDAITDDQAILLSDIFPTGYMGADLAEIRRGNTVAVFGCGPVGQFAIAGARLLGAGRVFAVDKVPSRLAMARAQGAEVIDFAKEDPVATLKALTGGIGVDRAIDAVGLDAEMPHTGPAAKKLKGQKQQLEEESKQVAPEAKSRRRQLASGRCAVAGAAMGGRVVGQGGHALDHRRLWRRESDLPHRRGDEQEPHHQDGQLQPSRVHPAADRAGPGARDRPGANPDAARAANGCRRGLQGVRYASGVMDQGRASAGALRLLIRSWNVENGARLLATLPDVAAAWRDPDVVRCKSCASGRVTST